MTRYYDGDTFEQGGRTFRVNIEYDEYTGDPWEENDGHGVVSQWTSRDKHAGEWVLCSDRGSKRYYDVQATMKIAKADGWGLAPANVLLLGQKLKRIVTKGDIVAEAVRLDFEYLRGWCNDEWHYVGVIVTDITDDGDAETDYGYSLWGVDEGYIAEVAHGLADQRLYDLREEAKKEKIAHRFNDAMECGV